MTECDGWCSVLEVRLIQRDQEIERLRELLAAGVASWERCDEIIRASGHEAIGRENALRSLVASLAERDAAAVGVAEEFQEYDKKIEGDLNCIRDLRAQIKWLEDRVIPAIEMKLVETKDLLSERDKALKRQDQRHESELDALNSMIAERDATIKTWKFTQGEIEVLLWCLTTQNWRGSILHPAPFMWNTMHDIATAIKSRLEQLL